MRSLFFTTAIFAMLPAAFFSPFVAVLVWSYISFGSPQRLTWGISDAIPFALVVGLTGILGWLVVERRKIPNDMTTWLLVGFIVSYTIATYFAIIPDEAWPKWWLTTKAMIYVFVTAALLTNRVRIHALMWVMVIAVAFYGIKGGIFALVTGGNYRIWGPAQTVIGDNNQIAAALVVLLPLMNYLGRQSKNNLLRMGSRVAMGLCLLSVLASYSRGSFLALIAMLPFLLQHSKRKVMSGVIIVVALAFSISFMPAQWVERIQTIKTYQQDTSAEGRIEMWEAATKMALARPLVGVGFKGPYIQKVMDKYSPGTTALAVHSIWFEVLGENGFPALFFWVGLAIVGILNCRYIIRRTKNVPKLKWANDLAHMSMVGLVGYYVGGSFLSLSYWDFYFTLLVMLAAARRIVVAELAPESKRLLFSPGAARAAARTRLGAARPALGAGD
ncbi:MAG: putative O-glycosylation ligase, exosortase A system-associated [Alphaproteobacteria bacterium]|nr:putative O-glycosylation ligase, exosortase A system-associated [Alphaproteobacteria bacterium]